MKIAIVGAGLSGLTAALALHKYGQKNIQVFERASEPSEAGAGIQLAPNAVRLLHMLGLSGEIAKIAHCSDYGELRRARDNRRLATLPYSGYFRKRYGVPAYHLLRSDLHRLLVDAVRHAQIRLNTGKTLLESRHQGQGVELSFADGSVHEADLVIAADGVGSVLSEQIFPGHSPRYSGAACWRGLINQVDSGVDRVTVWVDQDRHLVAYPVGHSSQVNLVATIKKPQWDDQERVVASSREDWTSAFEGCCPEVLSLIEQAPESRLWGLFEQRDLPAWYHGCQVLIGDAAHAMLPNLAQGAAQGMEDGFMLAQLLAGARSVCDIEAGLASFYEKRRERVKRVQEGARWNLAFFHQPRGVATALRDGLMRLGGPLTTGIIARKYHWLYSRSG